MTDIATREDLVTLMESFYSKALADETIGHYFTKVIAMQMEKHIPVIVDFWETIVFNRPKYQGDTFGVHDRLHHLSPFKDEHFLRWISLFKETANELFAGDKTELIKQRAESIATVMRIKLVHSGIQKPGTS